MYAEIIFFFRHKDDENMALNFMAGSITLPRQVINKVEALIFAQTRAERRQNKKKPKLAIDFRSYATG
jgi:hypothetical protein